MCRERKGGRKAGSKGTKCQIDREHVQPNLAKSTKRSRSETRSIAIEAKSKKRIR